MSNYSDWSEFEVQRMLNLRKAGHEICDVAQMIGRSEKAIKTKIARIKNNTTVTKKIVESKVRSCLKCGRRFDSQGAGNRICSSCHSTNGTNQHVEYSISR